MIRVKRFKEFNESISGVELVSPYGIASGRTKIPNTISSDDVDVYQVDDYVNPNSKNNLTSDTFSDDEYQDLYNRYLKLGGKVLDSTKRNENFPIIMNFLETNE